MEPFKEVIDGIRKAIMASEVREDIAQMGEYVEQFANTAGENIKKAIDPTLSVSGKAADAKATGEAVAEIKEEIVKLDSRNPMLNILNIEDRTEGKSWDDNVYTTIDNNGYDVCNQLFDVSKIPTITLFNMDSSVLKYYSDDGNRLSDGYQYITTDYIVINAPSNAKYMRVSISKNYTQNNMICIGKISKNTPYAAYNTGKDRSDIDILKEEIVKLDSRNPMLNILNIEDRTEGKSWDDNVYTTIDNNGYDVCNQLFDVSKIPTITLFNMDSSVLKYYSDDGNRLSDGYQYITTDYIVINAPSNAKYMRVSISKNYTQNNMICIGKISKNTPYAAYNTGKDRSDIDILKEEIGDFGSFSGKTLLFVGDSITYGAGWRPDPENYTNTGWVKIIKDNNPGANVYGYGVGGATIAISEGSVSICERITTMFAEHPNVDYIIMQGGVNDDYKKVPLGSVINGYDISTCNKSTFAGAMEYMLGTAQGLWIGKKLLFIITFKVPEVEDKTILNLLYPFSDYMNLAKTICAKWSVPVVDLRTESNLNYYIEKIKTDYSAGDGLHPNKKGYEIITPLIENKLKSI